jgi:hypothetical protein
MRRISCRTRLRRTTCRSAVVTFGRGEYRVGGFGEVKRRRTVRIMAHLAGMVGVVAAHAVHPANRKALRGSGDGQ